MVGARASAAASVAGAHANSTLAAPSGNGATSPPRMTRVDPVRTIHRARARSSPIIFANASSAPMFAAKRDAVDVPLILARSNDSNVTRNANACRRPDTSAFGSRGWRRIANGTAFASSSTSSSSTSSSSSSTTSLTSSTSSTSSILASHSAARRSSRPTPWRTTSSSPPPSRAPPSTRDSTRTKTSTPRPSPLPVAVVAPRNGIHRSLRLRDAVVLAPSSSFPIPLGITQKPCFTAPSRDAHVIFTTASPLASTRARAALRRHVNAAPMGSPNDTSRCDAFDDRLVVTSRRSPSNVAAHASSDNAPSPCATRAR
mmetsp:Transcript_3566/g.12884  ORF Transcript_3566/g.12884 Transcript_3566/m.12884 type:complete len:315 (-) Transcript_3566:22-966(-)